ncbi:MAG: hypothetical protein KF901_31630 [Myxococcales bacterium]|nr:hypothetical protein [Myxococcales bacterium]
MISIRVIAATIVMAMAPGCGDDDDTSGTDAGVDSGMAGGACTNPSDGPAIMRADYGPMMDKSVANIATEQGTACALGGSTGDALQSCTRDAIVEQTEMAVSSGCADCFALSVRCSVENCISVCVADPTGTECIACRCGDNAAMEDCDQAFRDCSGVPTTTCDGI